MMLSFSVDGPSVQMIFVFLIKVAPVDNYIIYSYHTTFLSDLQQLYQQNYSTVDKRLHFMVIYAYRE